MLQMLEVHTTQALVQLLVLKLVQALVQPLVLKLVQPLVLKLAHHVQVLHVPMLPPLVEDVA